MIYHPELDFDWNIIQDFLLFQPGYDRYIRLYEELKKTEGIVKDDAAAMNLLAIVGRREWNNDDKNGCTVHSAVYNLTDKTVMWVPNEHYGDEDSTFEFNLN